MSSLRKKLSFRRNGKKKRGAPSSSLFVPKSASASESTTSCSPPPLGSFPVSPTPRQACSHLKSGQEHISQEWSLAQHLKEQQQQENPKRVSSRHHGEEKNSDSSHHDKHSHYEETNSSHHHHDKNTTDLNPSPRDLWKQATVLDTAGNTLLEKGHFTRAKTVYERALALKQTSLVHYKDNEDLLASVATSINNIGYLQQRAGASPQDSMAAYQDALVIKQDILGPQSLSVGKTLNNIGSVYYSQQDYGNALSSYQQAKDIMELNLGEVHVDVATVYSNIGDVYMATSRKQEAILYYKRALEIRWMHLEEHSPKIRRLLEKIAMMEMNTTFVWNHESLEERLLQEDEDEQGGVQQELHLLQSQVEADIQQVGDLRRKMALDMVKDKLRILKGMRQIELHHDDDDEDDNGSAISAPSPPDSSVLCGSKTPPPLSPMERQDALSSVKERLAKLREQKSLRSLMEQETSLSSSLPFVDLNSPNDENEDAEMERQLGIAHLLELPKLNLESVLDDC